MDIVPDGKDIFLVVNSKYSRSQDWLHVHVMEGSAAGLEARRRQRPESFGATLMQIDSLDQLPKAVEALTGHALSTGEFSILVVGKKAVGNAKERLQVLVERIPECTFDNTERFYVR
jgi:CDP-diacylglycerol pyrophosphatase